MSRKEWQICLLLLAILVVFVAYGLIRNHVEAKNDPNLSLPGIWELIKVVNNYNNCDAIEFIQMTILEEKNNYVVYLDGYDTDSATFLDNELIFRDNDNTIYKGELILIRDKTKRDIKVLSGIWWNMNQQYSWQAVKVED